MFSSVMYVLIYVNPELRVKKSGSSQRRTEGVRAERCACVCVCEERTKADMCKMKAE